MDDTIQIVVTGRPVSKGRGRAAVGKNGKAFVFSPSNTRKWENDARQVARSVMGSRPPLNGPLQIIVRAVFEIPSSWPQWKRDMALAGDLRHTGKPDGDNVLKAAKDALNGIVYLDDSQVTKSGVIKEFGEVPAVRATIKRLPGLPSQTTKRPT